LNPDGVTKGTPLTKIKFVGGFCFTTVLMMQYAVYVIKSRVDGRFYKQSRKEAAIAILERKPPGG